MNKPAVAVLPILAILLGLLAASDKAFAQATSPVGSSGTLNVPESAVNGPLSESVKKQIRDYVRYWVERLSKASDVKQIGLARQKLVEGYKRFTSAFWRYAYAQVAAAEVPPALKVKDRVKQIHLSMALAQMDQVTVQPALEAMIAHANPVVRYWAVRGYRTAAKKIMDQGGSYAGTMLATLERLGTTERAGAVVGAIFRGLSPYPGAKPADVAKLRGVQSKVWLARCRELNAGDPEWIGAYLGALRFLSPQDKGDEQAVLQMLIDVLVGAAAAFDRASNQKGRVGEAFRELLINVEGRLRVLLRANQNPIQKILADPEITAEKAVEVRIEEGRPAPLCADLVRGLAHDVLHASGRRVGRRAGQGRARPGRRGGA